jgi:hypothetical protein
MSEYIKNAFSYWKLAYFQGFNGWRIAVEAAFLGYTDGAEWHNPKMNIIRMIVFCDIAGGKFIEGFMNQIISRLQRGQPPVAIDADQKQEIK